MKIIRFLLTLTALGSSLSAASAAISFNLYAERLNDANGNAAPVDSLVLLIADTAQSGSFLNLTSGGDSVGDLLNGKYKVVYRTNLGNFATPGVLLDSTPALTLDSTASDTTPGSWSPGDALAMVWFPTLTLSADPIIPVNAHYGIITAGTIGSDLFVTPSDGVGGLNLSYYSSEATNLNEGGPGAATVANFIVVPEPSATSLLTLGLAACIMGQRYRKRREVHA